MAKFKTLGEFAQETWRERAVQVRERYKQAVRPIYRALPNGRPEQFGSGVLMVIDGQRCLVTASHVLDEEMGHFLGVPPKPFALNLTFNATIKVNGQRAGDHVDVAVARLDDAALAATEALPFVPMIDQLAEPPPPGARMFLAMGYRASRNRAPLPGEEAVTPEIWCYRDVEAPVPNASLRLGGGGENFGVAYPKYGFRLNGERVRNASPAGASGGAIFDLGSVAELDLMGRGTAFTPRLAGILVECRKGVLINTHIDTVHGILRRAPPQGAISDGDPECQDAVASASATVTR